MTSQALGNFNWSLPKVSAWLLGQPFQDFEKSFLRSRTLRQAGLPNCMSPPYPSLNEIRELHTKSTTKAFRGTGASWKCRNCDAW